ncbi:MAG TPA: hypothetical protein VE173_08575 [Longimicrobiales bacterium]|nr:hypothetical protein [Longimicrobiales bacterium]
MLAARTLHEVVRDFPETLAALRAGGLDVAALGGRRLGDLEGGEELAATAAAAAAWRPEAPAVSFRESQDPS